MFALVFRRIIDCVCVFSAHSSTKTTIGEELRGSLNFVFQTIELLLAAQINCFSCKHLKFEYCFSHKRL